MDDLDDICKHFKIENKIKNISSVTSGHINDTYFVETTGFIHYVLQRLNNTVFSDPRAVIKNKILVSQHLSKQDSPYHSISFVQTNSGEYYHMDSSDSFWNMMIFLPNSLTHTEASSKELVCEAAKLLANFMVRLDNISVREITEPIPKFHSVPHRYTQFEKALSETSNEKRDMAKKQIEYARLLKVEMFQLEELRAKDLFPLRILHNDTKISNLLFNDKDEGLAVIDLDTVMPGIVHYDFGDAVRSMCSNRREDDEDINGINFKLNYYKAFCEGYASQAGNILSEDEKRYLTLGIKTIIYIMGLRFLTDYLNDNVYYKVRYVSHNLVRCKNQFALLGSVYDQFEEINSITEESLLNNIS